MSFPRYPKYKPSGVEWLGDVPEHWEVKPIRRVIAVPLSNGIFKKKEEFGDGVLLVNVFDIYRSDFKVAFETLDRVRCDSSETAAYEVLAGDLFFVRSSLKQEGIAVVAMAGSLCEPVVYECHLIRARPARDVFDGRFGSYLLNSVVYRSTMEAKAKVTTMTTIDQEAILSTQLPIPSFAEQTSIAAFLDRETAKIDELVAEQRRLMELLKEKRQAVISHAVTQGLNPKAPLKTSGIEWLGDVPEHWTAGPVKYVAKIGNGSTPSREVPAYWGESGFPWLNSSVVNSAIVTEAEGYVTERALRECHLPVIVPPAVLVGITGQGRTRGMASMLGIEATINQHVAYVKPSTPDFDVNFLLRIFEMAYLKLRHDSEEAGATKGAITCGQIGNLQIPFPPLAEQQAIVAHLDIELAKFATLTAEAQRAIDLLQERRTALISAAVTGQIDVRKEVA